MPLLALDTSANLCAACVYDEARGIVLAAQSLDIGRGHAEHLMVVIEALMIEAGIAFSDLEKVVTTIGPGSFTGIRVGVSAARGFGLALNVPIVGVSNFAALYLQHHHTNGGHDAVLVALSGGRGQVFAQAFDPLGNPIGNPFLVINEKEVQTELPPHDIIIGNAATQIATPGGKMAFDDLATADIGFIARASALYGQAPVPLYMRGADAKPQSGFALPRQTANGHNTGGADA